MLTSAQLDELGLAVLYVLAVAWGIGLLVRLLMSTPTRS